MRYSSFKKKKLNFPTIIYQVLLNSSKEIHHEIAVVDRVRVRLLAVFGYLRTEYHIV